MSENVLAITEESLKVYSDERLVLERSYLDAFIAFAYDHSLDRDVPVDDLGKCVELLENEILLRFCSRFDLGMITILLTPPKCQ